MATHPVEQRQMGPSDKNLGPETENGGIADLDPLRLL